MKIRVTLASDEGKILTNGKELKHMVYIDGTTDYSEWNEINDPSFVEDKTVE